jgi:serine/threonine protein kinase
MLELQSSTVNVPELRLENSLVDDRYLVDRCLGRGSYAEIFLAYDQLNEGRAAIIKSLNTSLQGTPDPELERTLVENFQNEAIALDRVRHPHIILRLGHGTAADLEGVPFHYIVLEYMPGGDLWSLCRQRPVGFDDALIHFQQVAEALAFAHSKRVIHRDIKPNNILLSADHSVLKIADFGVAKMAHDENSEITRVGTNVYAPPEHHPDVRDGELIEKLTPSADIYSLAKTIYTALTGRAPRQFSREPISSLPVELADQAWSQPLLAVLAKATASRVADRYQTVEEFWECFARVRTTEADAGEEVDDEATIVRSRLSATSTVEQVSARPNFQTLANPSQEIARPQKARIVVDLPGRAEPKHVLEEEETRGIVAEQTNTEADRPGTRTFGSPNFIEPASNGMRLRLQTPGREPQAQEVVARENDAANPRIRNLRVQTLRTEPGFLDNIRAAISSEWLRRVFIIFLAAALIGLAASTYYHFAGSKVGLPFLSHKDGRITGAQNVNLRSDPFGSVLVALPTGTRVRVAEERGNWMRVNILDWAGTPPDGAPDSGWVDSRFVKLD